MKFVYRFHANVERLLRLSGWSYRKNFDFTQAWRCNNKLHDSNKRKIGLPTWLLTDMKMPWYSVFLFLLFLGWERFWSLLWYFFRKYHSETTWSHFKVLSQQLRNTLTTTFERHLTVEDFTDMDRHSSLNKNRRKCLGNYRLHNNPSLLIEEHCTKTSHLLYAFFPLK